MTVRVVVVGGGFGGVTVARELGRWRQRSRPTLQMPRWDRR
jgi:NADH dehydrogenase FAD-containing subunit